MSLPVARRRSLLVQQWGILFAMLAILATTILSWKQLEAGPSQDTTTAPERRESDLPQGQSSEQETNSTIVIEAAASASAPQQSLSFEDIDYNRGWRLGKHGWVKINQYRMDSPIPLNLVQRVSPVCWAALLWMFAILMLVLAS